jgi:hypothetical protein
MKNYHTDKTFIDKYFFVKKNPIKTQNIIMSNIRDPQF